MAARRLQVGLAALLAAATVQLRAAGVAGADVLSQRLNARSAALGGTGVALEGDVAAVASNPALLANLPKAEFMFLHWSGLAEVATEETAWGQGFAFGSLSASIQYRYLPDIDNPGAVDGPAPANDLVASASYATSLDPWVAGFLPEVLRQVGGGASVKALRSRLGNAYGTAFAVDLGLRALAWEKWLVGLSLLNVGPAIQYISVSDPLPTTVLVGFSRTFEWGKSNRLLTTLDLEQALEDVQELGHLNVHSHAGLEDWLGSVFALRLGWDYQAGGLTGPSAGLGIKLDQDPLQFKLDYAYKPVYYQGFASFDPQQMVAVSLGY
jgi:hypothetical protein